MMMMATMASSISSMPSIFTPSTPTSSLLESTETLTSPLSVHDDNVDVVSGNCSSSVEVVRASLEQQHIDEEAQALMITKAAYVLLHLLEIDSMSIVNALPKELLYRVLEFLPLRDLCIMMEVSTIFRVLVQENRQLWRDVSFTNVWPSHANRHIFAIAAVAGNFEAQVKGSMASLYGSGINRQVTVAATYCGLLLSRTCRGGASTTPFGWTFVRVPWASDDCSKALVFDTLYEWLRKQTRERENVNQKKRDNCDKKVLPTAINNDDNKWRVYHDVKMAFSLSVDSKTDLKDTPNVENMSESVRSFLAFAEPIAESGNSSGKLYINRLQVNELLDVHSDRWTQGLAFNLVRALTKAPGFRTPSFLNVVCEELESAEPLLSRYGKYDDDVSKELIIEACRGSAAQQMGHIDLAVHDLTYISKHKEVWPIELCTDLRKQLLASTLKRRSTPAIFAVTSHVVASAFGHREASILLPVLVRECSCPLDTSSIFGVNGIQKHIEPRMIPVLCDWLVLVCETEIFHSSILFCAIRYIARFLRRRLMPIKSLQLIGITCLMQASRLFSKTPLPVREAARMCDGLYSCDDVIRMFADVISTLGGDFDFVTPINFLAIFHADMFPFGMLESYRIFTCIASFLLELTLYSHESWNFSAPVLAVASLCVIRPLLKHIKVPENVDMEKYLEYSSLWLSRAPRSLGMDPNDIFAAAFLLRQLYHQCHKSRFNGNALFENMTQKYEKSLLFSISLELLSDDSLVLPRKSEFKDGLLLLLGHNDTSEFKIAFDKHVFRAEKAFIQPTKFRHSCRDSSNPFHFPSTVLLVETTENFLCSLRADLGTANDDDHSCDEKSNYSIFNKLLEVLCTYSEGIEEGLNKNQITGIICSRVSSLLQPYSALRHEIVSKYFPVPVGRFVSTSAYEPTTISSPSQAPFSPRIYGTQLAHCTSELESMLPQKSDTEDDVLKYIEMDSETFTEELKLLRETTKTALTRSSLLSRPKSKPCRRKFMRRRGQPLQDILNSKE